MSSRRTNDSQHSIEYIGVKECIDIGREEFHTSSIEHNKSFVSSHFHDRRWHGQSNQCTTVADLHHARRHATGSNCISLQDHHQQRILITRSRSTVIWQDSFCRAPAHTTHHHLQISLLDIWTVIIASSIKIEEFLHKMASLRKIEVNNPSFYQKRLDLAVTSSQLLRLFAGLPIHRFISVYLSFHDTTPEGILSSCGCSLTLTISASIGIWHSAGATKGVTSPAAHRGIWHSAGVTRSWFHSPSWSKSFPEIQKCLDAKSFAIQMRG